MTKNELFRAMLAASNESLSNIDELLAPSGDNAPDFMRAEDEASTLSNVGELEEYAKAAFAEASKAGELSDQKRLRFYMGTAFGFVKLAINPDKDVCERIFRSVGIAETSLPVYTSKLRAFHVAAKAGTLDKIVTLVHENFAARSDKVSLENAVYKALVKGKEAAKGTNAASKVPPKSAVLEILNPTKAKPTRAASRPFDMASVVASQAKSLASHVKADQIETILAAYKAALEAALAKSAPVTDVKKVAKAPRKGGK